MKTPGLILVTGTSSGVGQACAKLLARKGYGVLACVRREEDGLKLKQRKRTTNRVAPVFIDTVVDFVKIYADRTHHGKEENILSMDLSTSVFQ